jgi:hypothetical protein
MLPVSNTPASVAVCADVSEFNQFTDWPTFTANGFGEYTPPLIVIVSRLGGFVPSGFVGDTGLVESVELPHPAATRTKPTTATRVQILATMEFVDIMRRVSRVVPAAVCS